VWLVERVAHRVSHERRRRTIQGFHRLYYGSPGRTWKNTRWLNVTAYKTPLDLWIYQELIVSLEPELIIETGTAHGGSALFLATVCDAVGAGEILTIDIEDRDGRPTHDRVTYLTGSSTAPETLAALRQRALGKAPVLVILDSDHSREHVLAELRCCADFVTPGSYLVVEDTNLNGHPVLPGYGPGPMEAVQDFLRERSDFRPDEEQEKFFLSFNPGGFLRREPSRSAVQPHRPRRGSLSMRPTARRRPARGHSTVLTRVVLALVLLLLVLAGLPEALGDKPFDPEPSAWLHMIEHA
jgi:cephalosporin hydroxylase